MIVAHESPIPYMGEVRELTDYCYLLPHLLDESEDYKKYFEESKKLGRYIIMDNSLHELGHPYDLDRLSYWLDYFKPNEFIVPDYWQEKTQTLVSAKSWMQKSYPVETNPVAVVQAKDKIEAWECYVILKMQGYKKIAFSYGADWYYEEGLKSTPDKNNVFLTKAHGRYNTIRFLYSKGAISSTDKIHLLGCNVPQEFSWYSKETLPFIESIDTSNPVIHGLAGIKYEDGGLKNKISTKVDKFEGNAKNWDIALYNINKFKSFIK